MFVFGFGLILIGYLWGFIFPINKALWTSSYVLFTGGIATIFLSIITYLIDIKHFKKPFWVFEVFGTNSIFIFILLTESGSMSWGLDTSGQSRKELVDVSEQFEEVEC